MAVLGYLPKLKRGLGLSFKIYLQATSNAMADRKKKETKMEIQKFKYLQNEKTFLPEIKNIFHSFLRAIIWLKINIW